MTRTLPRPIAAMLAAALFLLTGVAFAAYSPTTGTLSGADEDVLEHAPTNAAGGRAFMEFRSRAVAGSERHAINFLRFDLSGASGAVNAATLRFWIASSQVSSSSFAIDVYGITDGTTGEADWSASTLSYNNAPGLGAADSPNIDRDHAPGETVYLGTVTYQGGGYSGGLSLSSQALIDFINADGNDKLTFLLEPQVAVSSQDFFVHIRTAEGVGTDAGDFAPTLDLPGVTPPGESPPVPTDQVFLNESSGDLTVGNGIVRGFFNKTTGECTDLRFEGGTNLLLNGGKLYLDSNSGGNYYNFTGTYALVENTGQRVHFKITGRMGQFTVELHYLLEVGRSGFHCYTVFRHGAGDAATYLEQARMVLRCDKNVFTNAFTSENKSGQMIAPSLLDAAPAIMDATHVLPASSSYTTPTGTTDAGLPVYSKYDWADFMETHKAHGLCGSSTGLWMLSGSGEFMNGGPTKGELFVHGTDTTPLMIQTFHAGHFVGSDANLQLAADEVWEKVYGPYFIYLNSGAGSAALWQDALQRADAEKAAWPPAWMNETNFPVSRGTVTGELRADGLPAEGALMVLAQPGFDWQAQGRDYQFWSRSGAGGVFTIPKVRPGSYSLYGCVPGCSGQMELAQVTVLPGVVTDLGRLSWTPPRRSQTLWQIGTPDRSSAEFRHGDLMRQYGLWWRYLEEKGTAELNYTVGSSAPGDWYYAQAVTPLDSGAYHTPKWNVNFNIASIPSGTAEVVIDLAGAMGGTLNLTLNGGSIGSVATVNDAGLYRSATRLSRYRQYRVTFNASQLLLGNNVLSFQMNGRSNWSGTKPVSPASGVMYDAIRLEAGASVSENLVREYPLAVTAGPGGNAMGGGYFPVGTSTTIVAAPSTGYRFLQWNDGSTVASRQVLVSSAASYTASFELTPQGAFAEWAATELPSGGDHSFGGDADHDGIPNGFEFAYGPLVPGTVLLEVRCISGVSTVVFSLPQDPVNGPHTVLRVEATRDLNDWTGQAVTLIESQEGGERRWAPAAAEPRLFFRAVLDPATSGN